MAVTLLGDSASHAKGGRYPVVYGGGQYTDRWLPDMSEGPPW